MKYPTPRAGETWKTRRGAEVTITHAGNPAHTRAARRVQWTDAAGEARCGALSSFLKTHRPTTPMEGRHLPLKDETWTSASGATIFIIDGGDESTPIRERVATYRVSNRGRTSLRDGAIRTARADDIAYRWTLVVGASPAATC
jgi:hypothetical protein